MAFGVTPDLNKIRVFSLVVERGSLTAAAKSLGVPVSSVSRAISSLEKDVGIVLVERSARKTTLTSAGLRYYEHVQPALTALLEAKDRTREEYQEISGLIRLTASATTAAGLLTPLLNRFRQRYPEVTFEIVATSAVLDLSAEAIDLAVRIGPKVPGSAVARELGRTKPRLFACPGYLTHRAAPKSPEDLSSHDFVLFEAQAKRSSLKLEDHESVAVMARVRPAVVCDDYSVIHHAVLNGCGIGAIPAFLADPDVATGRLVRVLPRHTVQGASIWMISPMRSTQQPVRVALFKQWLLDSLEDAPGPSARKGAR